MSGGVGIALVLVAGYHLIHAALAGSIPTTTRRRISREEDPVQFWGACIVFGIAASAGLGLIAAALVR